MALLFVLLGKLIKAEVHPGKGGAGVWVVILGDTVRWERLTEEDEWMTLCLEVVQACQFLPTSTSILQIYPFSSLPNLGK